MMPSEILETFEHEGRTIFIRLEEDASDQNRLIVRPYYADGTLVNPFLYFVHKDERMKRLSEGEEDPVKEFVRSVRFDIEHEAEWEFKKSEAADKPQHIYKTASCKISIPKGRGLQKY
jgi:hypothetical protein